MSSPINIARQEELIKEAMDLRKNCILCRQTKHRCPCPFGTTGVCALHYGHPDQWPDMTRWKND